MDREKNPKGISKFLEDKQFNIEQLRFYIIKSRFYMINSRFYMIKSELKSCSDLFSKINYHV